MNQMVTSLQQVANMAYKTQEIVKTIASYPEASGISYIDPFILLLHKIKLCSISTIYEIIADDRSLKIQENLKRLNENMESVEEIKGKLIDALSDVLWENPKKQLEKNLQYLKTMFVHLASHIIRIYGENASRMIVSPYFLNGESFMKSKLSS